MSTWFPEKLLTWREPQEVQVARTDHLLRTCPLRLRLLWFVMVAFVVLEPWLIPPAGVPVKFAVPMALAMGLFMLILPGLTRYSPVFIRVTSIGIRGEGWTFFKDISRCALGPLHVGPKEVWTLKLTLKKGGERVLGVAENVSLRHLEELLKQQGLEVSSEARGLHHA